MSPGSCTRASREGVRSGRRAAQGRTGHTAKVSSRRWCVTGWKSSADRQWSRRWMGELPRADRKGGQSKQLATRQPSSGQERARTHKLMPSTRTRPSRNDGDGRAAPSLPTRWLPLANRRAWLRGVDEPGGWIRPAARGLEPVARTGRPRRLSGRRMRPGSWLGAGARATNDRQAGTCGRPEMARQRGAPPAEGQVSALLRTTLGMKGWGWAGFVETAAARALSRVSSSGSMQQLAISAWRASSAEQKAPSGAGLTPNKTPAAARRRRLEAAVARAPGSVADSDSPCQRPPDVVLVRPRSSARRAEQRLTSDATPPSRPHADTRTTPPSSARRRRPRRSDSRRSSSSSAAPTRTRARGRPAARATGRRRRGCRRRRPRTCSATWTRNRACCCRPRRARRRRRATARRLAAETAMGQPASADRRTARPIAAAGRRYRPRVSCGGGSTSTLRASCRCSRPSCSRPTRAARLRSRRRSACWAILAAATTASPTAASATGRRRSGCVTALPLLWYSPWLPADRQHCARALPHRRRPRSSPVRTAPPSSLLARLTLTLGRPPYSYHASDPLHAGGRVLDRDGLGESALSVGRATRRRSD